ncbi:MAG: HEAT repeat domain-containing protein [Candidatus Sericytochromatia bacterium]
MMMYSLRFRLRDPNPQVRESAALELIFAPDPDVFPELLALLEDSDADVRRTAIQALGALNSPDALQGLRNCLSDPVENVAIAARDALALLGSQAREAVLEWLENPEWPARASALRALEVFSPLPEVAQIAPLVQDPVWEVRCEAYQLLGRLQQAESLSVLMQALNHETQPLAREALLLALGRQEAPEARRWLLNAFFDPAGDESRQMLAPALQACGEAIRGDLESAGLWSPLPEVRSLSAALLVQLSSDVAPQLEPLLLDTQMSVRQTVAYALYQASPQQAFWEFVAGLYHPDDAVFAQALAELVVYPDPHTGSRLLDALDEMLLTPRALPLIEALGRMGHEAAAPALVELLEILPELDEQIAICRSLGRLRAWRAYPALQRLLAHPEPLLRNVAAQALSQISPDEPEWTQMGRLGSLSPAERAPLLVFLVRHPEARGFLVWLALNEAEPALQAEILEVLSDYAAPELGFLLLAWLREFPDPQPDTALAFLHAAGVSGLLPGMPERLLPWLHSREASIREGVLPLLTPHVTGLRLLLVPLLDDELWFVRQAALRLLARDPEQDSSALLEKALQDRDRDVRIQAVALLGQLNSHRAVELLVETLENGYRDIRAAAARALGAHRDPWAQEPLEIALAEDESPEVRAAAATALAALNAEEALDLIEEALGDEDDPEAMAVMLELLLSLNPQVALPWLRRALKSTEDALVARSLQLLSRYTTLAETLAPELQRHLETGEPAHQAQSLSLYLARHPEAAARWLDQSDPVLQAVALASLRAEQVAELQFQLVMLLDTPHLEVRQALLRSFARHPAMWPVLQQQAQQEQHPEVLTCLLTVLATLPAETTLPALSLLLQREDRLPVGDWLPTLLPFLNQGGETLLLTTLPGLENRELQQVFQQLAQAGEAALPVLQELTDSWDPALRLRALRTLGQLGEVALPHLQARWDSGNMAIQLAVLEAFKHLISPAALPILAEAARSVQDSLRAHAFEALAQQGEGARPLLEQLAQDARQTVRYDACRMLARLEPDHPVWGHLQGANSLLVSRRISHLIALQEVMAPEWLDALWHVRQDSSYRVRAQLCELPLGQLPVWREWLQRAAVHDVLPVRQAAVQALSQLSDADITPLLLGLWEQAPASLREALLTALSRLGLPWQALLGLEDSARFVRLSAACAVGQFRLTQARERLCELLHSDPDREVRATCSWALGQLADPESLPVLEAALQAPDYAVRLQSVIALGNLQVQSAGEALLAMLRQESDIGLLEEVLRSLQRLHFVPAVPELIALTRHHGDLLLRQQALESLALLGGESVKGHLQEVSRWREEPELAAWAQTLLSEQLVEQSC